MQVKLTDFSPDGRAVGRTSDGKVVFVPGGIPGEVVHITPVKQKKSWMSAKIDAIHEPSSSRISPICNPECGGCSWQHIDYDYQLVSKVGLLLHSLRELNPPVISVSRAAEAAVAWRRRVRWHVFGGRVGNRKGRSHEIEGGVCVQTEPPLQKLQAELTRLVASRGTIKMDVSAVRGAEGIHVVIEGKISNRLLRDISRIQGVAGVQHGEKVLGAKSVTIDDDCQISASNFAQASTAGNRKIREQVTLAASRLAGEEMLELFCGNGNLTRDLAAHAESVIAVDTSPGRHPGDWKVVTADAAAYVESHKIPKVVVLDPPRIGAKEVCSTLADKPWERILYVSCDPMTLARDITLLGAEIEYLSLIDTMPNTPHFESVALLRRRT